MLLLLLVELFFEVPLLTEVDPPLFLERVEVLPDREPELTERDEVPIRFVPEVR